MAIDGVLPPLVVIGASAGGIEALTILLGSLHTEFPAPVVIAQHLDPARPSRLQEVLQRHSTLPLRTVQSEARLEQGVVYLVPSNRDVEIVDGHVQVRMHEAPRVHEALPPAGIMSVVPSAEGSTSKPSVDRLLRTAAIGYGEGLIAVILSGLGVDGAAGARDVKEAGGTVVVQNPATARFPGMPQSLAPTTVDVVAELEAIGPLLYELLTGPRRIDLPEEDRRLRALLSHVRQQTGIDFSTYKSPTILRRLQRRMVATDTSTLADYLRYLQRHPEEYHRLATSFLIKVTGFFRDPDLYRHLRDEVLPELIEDARARRSNELRLWSAGCATGEEAYSLAMIVAEVLGDEIERFTVRVFATDLDDDAIGFARRGVYPAQALEDVPRELVQQYFTAEDGEYTVRKRIRGLTVFGQHDLGQRAPFPRIDLAMCRNVLIYFTPELQKRALQLFAFALRHGGYLALGKAETTTPLAEYFTLSDARLKVYRREGGRSVALPVARIRDVLPGRTVLAPAAEDGAPRSQPADEDAEDAEDAEDGGADSAQVLPRLENGMRRMPRGGRSALAPPRSSQERAGMVLQHLPMGVVLVDRRYDIQLINAAARRLLGIHSTAIGDDFIHQVRQAPSRELRQALDAALREEQAETPHRVTAETSGGDRRLLQIECFPYRTGPEREPYALVLVVDGTETAGLQREAARRVAALQAQLAAAEQRHQEELRRQSEHVQQLVETNQELLEANQELIETNTELHNQNEQLLVGHEEAEAATEEVETLNEELQATNEEQETLNEELQATVEELNTTNDELEARSVELQQLAASLEAERTRLQAILSSMGDAVLVLDAAGTPLLVNDAYRSLFGEATNGTIALPQALDTDGHPLPTGESLPALAARRQPFTLEFAVRGKAHGALRWLEAKGQPVDQAETGDGTVITIRDVSARRRGQND